MQANRNADLGEKGEYKDNRRFGLTCAARSGTDAENGVRVMNYPMLDTFLSIMWFFLWILWIFLLVRVTLDIFRDDRLGGWGKAGWLIFVLILPYLGVLVYLIARGHGMGQRDLAQAKQQKADMDDYIRSTAAAGGGGGGASAAEQLSKIAELKNSGALTEQEYQMAKAKILA